MRFRKSIKIGGARVNFSKSGVGASFGVKGLRYSVHSSGRRTTTVGIPGTGLSHVSTKGGSSRPRAGQTGGVSALTPSQQQKLIERHAKKIQLASERRSKPLEKLKEQYSAGKITQSVYNDLVARDADVTIDLMIFGRGAGAKLAERYMLGKIDKVEFENLKNEVVGEPEAEKDRIIEDYKATIRNVSDYVEKTRSQKSEDQCNNCSKLKKFFSPLYTVSDFKLCGTCKKQFNQMCMYSGINGQYYSSDSSIINPDIKNSLSVNILTHHILEYR